MLSLLISLSQNLFRSFRPIMAATLLSVGNSLGIENTSNDMVSDTRQIFYTTTTNHNHRVLLQVVSLASDVRDHFLTIGEANLCYFSKRWVWLLWCGCIHLRTYYPSLRSMKSRKSFLKRIPIDMHRWRLAFFRFALATLSEKLINSWHDGEK